MTFHKRILLSAVLLASVPSLSLADKGKPAGPQELETSGGRLNKTLYLETETPKGRVPPPTAPVLQPPPPPPVQQRAIGATVQIGADEDGAPAKR